MTPLGIVKSVSFLSGHHSVAINYQIIVSLKKEVHSFLSMCKRKWTKPEVFSRCVLSC